MNQKVINNRFILGILNEFQTDFGLKTEESKSFEHLINYLVLSKIDPDAFSDTTIFDRFDVDKSGTFGIDAFAITINDAVVTCEDDIRYFQRSNRMDVKFLFIQTKRSTQFDSGEFLKFSTAVKNFFSPTPSIELSDELEAAKELLDFLFQPENARLFSSNKPTCELYYAGLGKKSEDTTVLGIFEHVKNDLENNIPEISSVSIKQIDPDYIIDSYNELENRTKVILTFEKHIPCSTITNVEQSFIGFLPVTEFMKLIKGSDGNIRKNLFYENVRDFQGQSNSVNSEIAETLSTPEKIDQFILLNNGVTIVAKSFMNLKATEYEISDYYIVNGCQTSNVIFNHFDLVQNKTALNIPVKIVHTTDNSIINSLIRSTNRQTPVPDEAFVSLEKFHKRLQEYYKRYGQDCFEKLYYERRSKELSNGSERIEKQRIINLHAQIRSFISIIWGEPQLAMSNNPTSILKEHNSKMFNEDHKYLPYYLSSLLMFLFYRNTEDSKISKKYVVSRYWICWITRVLTFKSLDTGNLNSDKTEKNVNK
jgi:hypothetical protein